MSHELLSYAFLLVALAGALLGYNALFPQRTGRIRLIAAFFASWLTGELAVHLLAWQIAVTGVFVGLGALSHWPGRVALGLTIASWAVWVQLWRTGRAAGETLKQALDGVARPGPWPRVPLDKLLFPFLPGRRGVKRTRDIVFADRDGEPLRLDVYEPRESTARRPAVIQVHGGAWVIGDKREQGLPLLNHLAANGWVGFNINYRLSPAATFPDHLVDVKAAIAWVREHADRYGVDPNFVAVTGGSAGGHLAALAALTSDDRRYQPGFEGADVSIQAAALFYGVYDLTDRLGLLPPSFRYGLLRRSVLKVSIDDAPELYSEASPVDRVHAGAPPILLIHGDRDTLSPVAYARLFAERLREVSDEPVVLAELRGAQHAFDVFSSPRTVRAVAAVERFFDAVHHEHGEKGNAPAESSRTSRTPFRASACRRG